MAAVSDWTKNASGSGVAGTANAGVGGAAVADPGHGGERDDGRGEILRHQCGGGIAGEDPGGGVPASHRGACVSGGEIGGRADAL